MPVFKWRVSSVQDLPTPLSEEYLLKPIPRLLCGWDKAMAGPRGDRAALFKWLWSKINKREECPRYNSAGNWEKNYRKLMLHRLKFFFFFFKLWFCKPCSLHFAAARVGLFCQSAHNDYLRLDICASDSLHYISSWNSNGSLYAAFGGENDHTHTHAHTRDE